MERTPKQRGGQGVEGLELGLGGGAGGFYVVELFLELGRDAPLFFDGGNDDRQSQQPSNVRSRHPRPGSTFSQPCNRIGMAQEPGKIVTIQYIW